MAAVLAILLIGAATVACLVILPPFHHALDRVGLWLEGTAPYPRADIRLGAFLGVFIAAALIIA